MNTPQTPTAPTVGNSDVFGAPTAVTGLDCAFGGEMKKLLPPWDTIPDEYKRHHGTKWTKIVAQWFFGGLPKGTNFVPKPGIDSGAAVAHLRAILVSFAPKHEHKEAGVAYLMSKWFEDVVVPNPTLDNARRCR